MHERPASGPEHPPEVSICLLVYNRAHTLPDVLESALAQDFRSFELLVSDDCSTDRSWEIISDFSRRDCRIRALRTPQNLGMAGNANFAVAQTRGRYIALLHHDDLVSPKLLTRWTDVATRHPNIAVVSCAYRVREQHGSLDGTLHFHQFSEHNDGGTVLTRRLFGQWGCPIRGTALVRKACWDQVGGMRERFGMLADVDLWMRLAARWDLGYVADPLITVRHDRPDSYPIAYTHFDWRRFRLLYEIHATNRREYFGERTARAKMEMLRLRWRVSNNELFWLAYAISQRNWDALRTSDTVKNPYELLYARLARAGLEACAQALAPA
jgi:glycosyltransferase involved in cell wall biosynthesis